MNRIAMTSERWNKIKALFAEAQDCPENERAEFLSQVCGNDLELKSEVEELLYSHQKDDSFLQNSAIAEVSAILDEEMIGGFPVSSDSSPSQFKVGMLLNERYEILRLLGRGGMGEVYLARDTKINRDVALKVLHSDLVSSKELLSRFAVEAQAVSALNHPHIMTIYEVSKTGKGVLFFVGEYVEGLSLDRLIGADLKLDKALGIAIQVSLALTAAHETGITHRDIKPENIMVRPDEYVKVLDFGLAKITRENNSPDKRESEEVLETLSLTKPGETMGTAAYMSPEQARGIHIDARTDIWSLGVVIYEMLTGRKPFSGKTTADIVTLVLSKEPPPMTSDVSDLPAELKQIVSKALSKNVDDRYQTAQELRADLEKIKKQVEFKRTLTNSAEGNSRNDRSTREATQVTSIENIAPTSPDKTGRATDGGQDNVAESRSFLSSPSFAGAFRQVRTQKIPSSIIGFVILAFISSAVYFLLVTPGDTQKIDSIAVLPFENLSGNPELDYVSDGLSDSLINRLSQLSQLKVISRNSSFKFRGADIDVSNVASQLGVQAVVTGSIDQIGDDLLIRFDIVEPAENRHITGGQYRRKPNDILRIQSEIAQTATEQLRLKLTDSQSKRFTENVTENSEAYRYYLSGLVELNGPQDVYSKALDHFQRAVKLDPNFAAAYVEIGWVYVSRANGNDNPHEIMPKAIAAIERALVLDPNLAKAHVIQAMLKEYEFDWQGAELEHRRAIELNPNLDFARNYYAFFLSVVGRQDEALAELEQQRIRDPINQRMALLQAGIILAQARKFDEALRTYEEVQALEATNEVPNFALGYVYAGKGLYREAAGYYKQTVDMLGGEEKYSQPLVYLAATYAKIPEKRIESRRILKSIEAQGGYASPALLAAVYSALDDNDKAIELLEQAYIRRDLLLRYIKTGYEYDGLRSDPRFVDLEKKIGFKQ